MGPLIRSLCDGVFYGTIAFVVVTFIFALFGLFSS